MKQFTYFLLLLILFCSLTFSQWSTDPAQNLAICDAAGEQALSKITSTFDGGTYVSWFDNRSGNYSVYMQRLDPLGFEQWDANGLLISGNPQSSSLVDYDLMTDADDNAIVVFTDTRNAGDLNVFAYKISPTGDFLWGANGVSLSSSTEFQANPKVTQTADGNYVIVWLLATTPTKVALQKLSPSGTKLWGNDPVLIESVSEGYNYPDVVPSDSNSVIVIHTTVTGNFPAQTIKLRATKVASNGTFSWISMLQDLGGISFFHEPQVYSDFHDGGIVSWHDDRNFTNLQSAYVQRVTPDNILYFPIDGANASLMPSRHKFNPVAAIDRITEEMYVFWVETNSSQSQNGISGQKLSINGTRMWNDNGKIFKDLSSPNTVSISNLNAQPGGSKTYVFYLEGNAGGLNDKLEGFACDSNGDFLWTNNFIVLSNPTDQKLHLASTVDIYYNCKLSWSDDRGSSRDIYAQDINPSGELGNPVIPVELTSFTGFYSKEIITLNWATASETNNAGFEIQKLTTDWQKIGFVHGAGTTTEAMNYSFIDENIITGLNSYRLKQVDFDGSFEYSDIIEIETVMPNEFNLEQNYPNPFNPSTKIRFSISDFRFTNLKVYNVLGKLVATLINKELEAGNYNFDFNASDLPSGIYYYSLTAGTFTETKKMILIK
ncbi:T9SS type A sorting domain-containing protein [Bacteroidota bacterium]